MRRSISQRLSLTFAAVSLVVFTLVGVGLFALMQRQLFDELRDTLDTRARIAVMIVSHAQAPTKWNVVQDKLADLSPPGSKLHYYVNSPDPAFRFGEPVKGDVVDAEGPYQTIRQPGSRYNVIVFTVDIPPKADRPAMTLTVASDCENTQSMLDRFGIALGILIAGATALVLLLSRVMTRFALAPLTRLSNEAALLSPGNRHERLHADALHEELHELTTSFNGALERLDHAYERLESFNADVAHELRTPVTILIGQTEVALTRDRSAPQLRQTLQSNLEELGRMRGIVNDMLFLSRSDRGERATELSDVSLRAEVSRMLEFLDIPLDEAQLEATLHGDARATVNTSLFGRAISNLLVNAIEHSAPGTRIRVNLAQRGERVDVTVSNPGEPIDPAARAHIFDRFYRLQESRSDSRENHGLGLSIVKAVAEMHDGDVFVQCEGGVNTFGFSVATGIRNGASAPRTPRPRNAGRPVTSPLQ